MSEEERVVFSQLTGQEPCDVDTLAVRSGVPVSSCAAMLVGLELKRMVRQLPGQRFVKTS